MVHSSGNDTDTGPKNMRLGGRQPPSRVIATAKKTMSATGYVGAAATLTMLLYVCRGRDPGQKRTRITSARHELTHMKALSHWAVVCGLCGTQRKENPVKTCPSHLKKFDSHTPVCDRTSRAIVIHMIPISVSHADDLSM